MTAPTTPVPLTLRASPDKAATTTTGELSTWTRERSIGKAWRWTMIVLAIGAVMLPIPVVHFFAIPVVLIGAPVMWFGIYKLHAGATDLQGTGTCPQCDAEIPLQGAADRWPLARSCPSCRSTVSVERG